jgi:hypothetical protein
VPSSTTTRTPRPANATVAPAADPGEDYWLTTSELGERYHAPEETIRYWRHISYGPRGVKIGRRVLYALDEVHRWEREQEAVQGGGPAA